MTRQSESTHPNREAFPVGIGGPALRALQVAGVRALTDLARWTEAELLALHGMGPKGVRILGEALVASGQRFRQP